MFDRTTDDGTGPPSASNGVRSATATSTSHGRALAAGEEPAVSTIRVADFSALGTQIRVAVAGDGDLGRACTAAKKVIAAVDVACSRFRDDSELARVNRTGGAWVTVSPLFARSLLVAVDAARLTHGLVDPTVGTAMIDIGYDRTFADLPADGPAVVAPVRPCPGWWTIEFDAAGPALRVPAGTLLDLGSTAKAMAADMAAEAAAEASGSGVLVSCGGDIAIAGRPPADGWTILVTEDEDGSPIGPGQCISIETGGVATSGTRTRRWRRGGVSQHHIVDPSTGRPAEEYWRTASVVAATCADANMASTAALILGPAAPRWLGVRDLPSRLVDTAGRVRLIGGWPDPSGTRTS